MINQLMVKQQLRIAQHDRRLRYPVIRWINQDAMKWKILLRYFSVFSMRQGIYFNDSPKNLVWLTYHSDLIKDSKRQPWGQCNGQGMEWERERGTQTQSSGVKRDQLPISHLRGYKLCGDVCGRKQASEGRAALWDLVRYRLIFRNLPVSCDVMRRESNPIETPPE